MIKLVERFPEQLKEALEIGGNATINPHDKEINKIYLAGLGGSGIGGNFVAEFVRDECKVPFLVGKGFKHQDFQAISCSRKQDCISLVHFFISLSSIIEKKSVLTITHRSKKYDKSRKSSQNHHLKNCTVPLQDECLELNLCVGIEASQIKCTYIR